MADAALIAAAVVLAFVKAFHDLYRQIEQVGWWADAMPADRPTEGYLLRAVLEAWLVVGSCAWPVIRLIRPRPSIRRLLDQPGASAVAAAVGMLALERLEWLILVPLAIATRPPKRKPRGLPVDFPWELLDIETPYGYMSGRGIGSAVVAAWVILVVSRRWRREPGWIDATGTMLGLGWIAYLIAEMIPALILVFSPEVRE